MNTQSDRPTEKFILTKKNITILAVVLTSIGISLLAVLVDPIVGLAAAALPLGVYWAVTFLSTTRFSYIPVVILIFALFVPFSLGTGTDSDLVDSLLLTIVFSAIWFVRLLFNVQNIKLARFSINFPLAGFMLITLLAYIWSNVFRDPLVSYWESFPMVQLASTVVMIMLPLAFLMVPNFVHDLKTIKWMATLIILAGIFQLIANFFPIPFGINSRGLFSMWVIAISLALAYFNNNIPLPFRVALFLLAAGWLYWGYWYNYTWLAGWVPGVFVFGLLSVLRSKKLAILILGLFILYIVYQYDEIRWMIYREFDESGLTRVAAWQVNWRITSQHLLLGTGPAGYAAYYMSYFPREGMATHSNYIDMIAQTGILGITFLLWFFINLFKLAFGNIKNYKYEHNFSEAMGNATFAGFLGCLLMMAFGDWMFPFAYTQSIEGFDYIVVNWLMLGVILVLYRAFPVKKSTANAA